MWSEVCSAWQNLYLFLLLLSFISCVVAVHWITYSLIWTCFISCVVPVRWITSSLIWTCFCMRSFHSTHTTVYLQFSLHGVVWRPVMFTLQQVSFIALWLLTGHNVGQQTRTNFTLEISKDFHVENVHKLWSSRKRQTAQKPSVIVRRKCGLNGWHDVLLSLRIALPVTSDVDNVSSEFLTIIFSFRRNCTDGQMGVV